jgi:hypothetical protein
MACNAGGSRVVGRDRVREFRREAPESVVQHPRGLDDKKIDGDVLHGERAVMFFVAFQGRAQTEGS